MRAMYKTNSFSTKTTIAGISAAALLLVLLTPMSAFAAPRLHASDCEVVDGNLECSFDVSGLGGATTATGTLTGTAEITTGCINRGAAGTQPSGLERSTEDVLEEATVNVEGGRATFDLSTDFDPEEIRTCPDGMTEVIVCASFTDLSLEVVPNSGPSRTFEIPDESDC
jgi:hypothetical protein